MHERKCDNTGNLLCIPLFKVPFDEPDNANIFQKLNYPIMGDYALYDAKRRCLYCRWAKQWIRSRNSH